MKKRLAAFCVLTAAVSHAQDFKIKPFIMAQPWLTYTENYDVPGSPDLKEHQTDFFIRRGRFGFKGRFNPLLKFKLVMSYDKLWKTNPNPNDGAKGSVKFTGETHPKLQFLDVFLMWKALGDEFVITGGHFRPQVGRANITSGFKILSLEKGLPNFYVRNHVIGKPLKVHTFNFATGNGRATNITFGGLILKNLYSLNYNFSAAYNQNYVNSKYSSPLLTGRVAVSIGDPEMKTYKLGYTQTYLGKRKGITFAINGSYQGEGIYKNENKPFDKNYLYGGDILANYKNLDFVFEYDFLGRKWKDGTSYLDKVWQVKAGYILSLFSQKFEPAVSYEEFKPDSNGYSVYKKRKNTRYDVGVNWYIRGNRLKLSLHYAKGKLYNYTNKKTGDVGTVNVSYIGLGFQFIF